MPSSLDNIWEEVLNVAKTEMTEVSFNTWLRNIKPIKLIGDTVFLGAPNDFTLGILRDRYSKFIESCFTAVTDENLKVEFQLESDVKTSFEDHNSSIKIENEEKDYRSALLPRYTFDTFVIGKSNTFAHAASLAVAEAPAAAYNPLFIYGGVGLGKTHLMHAIAHYVLDQNPNAKVVYVSSEKFTNELINSIRESKNEEFREKYRNVDVLLVDDIQFIGGKEGTQEEFFHTFNALHENNKQIIISSDRPPRDIPTLEERLRSRFEWGLITDIQAPDFETRIAILRNKANIENIELDDEVLNYIATKITTNIRELEGALIRVEAYGSLTNNNLDLELAEEALKGIISEKQKIEVTPMRIQEIVAEFYDIDLKEMIGRKRSQNIAYPRQIAMYLTREMTDLSLPKIGEEFDRDHTTVIHAYDKITEELETKLDLQENIEEIREKIIG